MSDRRLVSAVLSAVLTAVLAWFPQQAIATQKWGGLQLSGNLQTQNLIRHPDASHFEYIQNRNTAHIRLDYDWVQGGKFYSRYNIPFIESSNLFLLYRGVYDSVYDTTPGFVQKGDIHGKVYTPDGVKLLNYYDYALAVKGCATHPGTKGCLRGNNFELSGIDRNSRDAYRFENNMREAYADMKFRGVPLTIRAGKQQIVWGETDNFRMLDRANPLDLTWHLQQEIPAPALGWDAIRQPLWMIKFLYDLGDIGPLSQNYLEWYWNPGDWRPAKQAFLPRPWGLPILDPLTNPVDGAFNQGVCAPVPGKPGQTQGVCNSLMNDTKLFKHGDWNSGAFENNQVGVRYHGSMPFGMEFTLNYFYQRWSGDDGTNFAQLRALPNTAANQAKRDKLIQNAIFPAEYIAPYVHTVGLSANYSDEAFTQAVFRMETVYDFGIPMYDVSRVTVVNSPTLPGITSKNMWKGMIGFDRPTWIKTLNKKSTIFLTGQFFWHYIPSNPSCSLSPQQIAGSPTDPTDTTRRLGPNGQPIGSCLVGGLDLPSSARGNNSAFRDKIRDWETLATFAAFSFYRGGSIVPVLGLAVDTTNQFNMEPFWDVDYIVKDYFVINIGQRYFFTPRGHSTPNFETWGVAGLNATRSETSIRLSYQF